MRWKAKMLELDASLRQWRSLRRWWRAAALVPLVATAVLAVSLRLDFLASVPALFVSELDGVADAQRLLVIAPHCDDETIACGGLIQLVKERGGQVRVVLVTNGDGSFTGTVVEFRKLYPRVEDYFRSGERRQEEALRALGLLGLNEGDVVFLSYPDQGIAPLWKTWWDSSNPYRSPYTQRTQSPYARTYSAEAVYSGQSLLADLWAIVRDFQPDVVLAPDPADTHRDHWASGAFAALATMTAGIEPRPRLLTYLVHWLEYPQPRGSLPFVPLLPPLRLVADTAVWGTVPLPGEMVEVKAQAVEAYSSQLPLLGGFLRSFVRQNELYCQRQVGQVLRLAEDQAVTPMAAAWRTADGQDVRPLFEDPAGDSMGQRVEPGGDFVALYVAQSQSELWVAARLRGGSSRALEYSAYCLGFNGAEVSHGRVRFPRQVRRRAASDAEGEYVLARFSLGELGFPSWVMVHFEAAFPGGPVSDRVGWAIAELGMR